MTLELEGAALQTQPGPPSRALLSPSETPSADPVTANVVTSLYGSFWIDKTEFAIPVEVIQEMVGEPASFTPVPLSPPHMLGLFNLRDTIVPVVDLRILLGFPDCDEDGGRKIAIIENGEHCIGLLFDEAGGVISNEHATRVNFEANAEGIKDVVIDGMLKLENGTRMVQVLNPFELLNIKQLPRIAKTKGRAKSHLGKRLNCISFQVGHTRCALDLRYVQEVTDVPDVQSTPLAHGNILGNIELRGQTLPIVDFRGMMGYEPPHKFSEEALRSRKLLILNLPEGLIGLLVYSIDSIMTFFEADILPFASITLPRHDIVSGCLMNASDEIVILLNHEKLLRDEALAMAARSCQEVYPPEKQKAQKARDDVSAARSTFILFTVEMQFAVDISGVSEIIDRPDALLKPPYALNYVDGILNLRGDLITLINPRVLYQLPNPERSGEKVLIFHKNGKKHGIVVDSVDEIVNVTSQQLLDVPSIERKGTTRVVSEDVSGCLWVPSKQRENDPVLILDTGSLVSRCVDAQA